MSAAFVVAFLMNLVLVLVLVAGLPVFFVLLELNFGLDFIYRSNQGADLVLDSKAPLGHLSARVTRVRFYPLLPKQEFSFLAEGFVLPQVKCVAIGRVVLECVAD